MQLSAKCVNTKFKLTKIMLSLKCLLIISIILIFYLRFLIAGVTKDLSITSDSNDNYISSNRYKRSLLSVDLYEEETSLNCSPASILEFPSDGLDRQQRLHGWILLHIILVFYGFWFLATICDDYMVPAIEQICSNFKIEGDVIGATIMAAAVSSPELFMNFVGTFITKGDIGVSAIVGSAVFNMLAVPACCGLFALQCLKLDWWPITRDCLIFLTAILTFLGILRDGKVMWYEAMGLILAYIIYMLVMYYNKKMAKTARRLLQSCGAYTTNQYREVSELSSLLPKHRNESAFSLAHEAYLSLDIGLHSSHMLLYLENKEKQDSIRSPWSSQGHSVVEFVCRWPITFLLWLTVPNCRKHSSFKYLTFSLAIMWTGIISYLVAFGITIIGDTLNIPDSVMGLTILAAGMSIPEAVCSIIVTRHGQASTGLSNSLGSNTFDILLSLGLPWFIKAYFLPDNPQEYWVSLNSNGLTFAGVSLLTSLMGLYIIFASQGFTLNRKVGFACLALYLILMTISILVQLNVFFPVNLPVCRH
ncbi:sodium/potassium/calcium exchanger 5-like [Haematobia irritans]|uniref:sodium/potassium/calcium exchanger 5-like n=1 Tax=Haematobia irritans TaxID=7368 RepID=UPI003F4FB349